MGPQMGVTEDKVNLMISAALKAYEREVVEPRHKETQNSLDDIKRLVQQGSGAVKLGSALMGLGGFVWIVLQIMHHLKN